MPPSSSQWGVQPALETTPLLPQVTSLPFEAAPIQGPTSSLNALRPCRICPVVLPLCCLLCAPHSLLPLTPSTLPPMPLHHPFFTHQQVFTHQLFPHRPPPMDLLFSLLPLRTSHQTWESNLSQTRTIGQMQRKLSTPDYNVHPIGQENQKRLSLLMQMPPQVSSGKKSLPTTANPQYQISLWKNVALMVKVSR
jgi:hypothetical protein